MCCKHLSNGCKLAPVAPTCSLQISIKSAIAESSPHLWYEFVSKWGTADKSHVLAFFLALKSPCIQAFPILKQTSTPHLAGCMPLYPILSRFQLVYVGLIPISCLLKIVKAHYSNPFLTNQVWIHLITIIVNYIKKYYIYTTSPSPIPIFLPLISIGQASMMWSCS